MPVRPLTLTRRRLAWLMAIGLAVALYPAFVLCYPDAVEKLFWGSKVLGLRVDLAKATPSVVEALVDKAYETRVNKDAGPKRARKPALPDTVSL